MELLLLRHGDAEFSLPDSARQLTAKGESQVVEMAKNHRRNLQGIELVLSSPMRRAIQTTALFVANAELNCKVETVDYLLPDSSVENVECHIQSLDHTKILMVGHLPLLDNWIGYLTGNCGSRMATASLASLSMDYAYKGLASLNWIYHVD
ncbi:phosphohistidine phosphatase SixA [Porticoccaceae bacterium]|nr:phosphohistidine phosphatase SixA [Porticoccaceae bacterium]